MGGLNEAILLYVLGLGSPTHALPEASYAAWTRTYRRSRQTSSCRRSGISTMVTRSC
jgi:hypothetical protein